MRLIDLTGQKFGKLTVIERAENHVTKSGQSVTMWRCACDCCNEIFVSSGHLKSGHTKSCGCWRNDNPNHRTHGITGSRIYNIWASMKQRCYNPKDEKYPMYGSRGIKVCSEWHCFESFYNWAMANGYRDNLSIDRIDNDGDYCPENCRWATAKEQQNNTRRNRHVEYNGKEYTIAELAREYSIPYKKLWSRLFRFKWSIERAINTP